jgi:hypothetical protein
MNIELCTLSQLVRAVASTYSAENRINSRQVKQALLILWKHNCLIVECNYDVDLTEVTMDINGLETKLKMTNLLYRLHYDNVLNRMRFGNILSLLSSKYGQVAMLIAEEVIFHGRLRYNTITDEVLNKWKLLKKNQERSSSSEEREEDEEEEEYDENHGKAQIKDIFEQLVKNRYLILVPPLDIKNRVVTSVEFSGKSSKKSSFFDDSKPSSSASSTAAGGAKTTVKRARSTASAAASASKEQEMLPVELRLLLEQQQQLQQVGINDSEEAEWEEPSAKKAKTDESGKKIAGGRGAGRGAGRGGRGRGGRGGKGALSGSLTTDANDLTINSNSDLSSRVSASDNYANQIVRGEVYWMIGFDQYLREERHRVCADIVSDQLENIAGEIVRIILQSSMNSELGSNPSKSSAMTLDEIFSKIKEYTSQQQQNKQHQQQQGTSSSSATSNVSSILSSIDIITLKKLLDVMRLSSMGAIVRVSNRLLCLCSFFFLLFSFCS